jgi:hypothetical protein
MKTRFLVTGFALFLAACGGGGGGSSPVPAPVPPPVVNTPAPTVNVLISKTKTTVGAPVTVSWSSTNATSCVGLDGMSGAKALNNSEQITPAAGGQYTYTVSCDGNGGTAKQSVALVVPMPVFKTSHANAKNLNIPARPFPIFPSVGDIGEYVATGVAYGDFFQEGKISMVVATAKNEISRAFPLPGRVLFYRFDNAGNPIENTAALLSDTTACIATRKVLVADFNGDGQPDVYFSCHGSEFGGVGAGWTGEQTRILLSQPNGRYTNEQTGLNCYCHGAAAADLNNDGKVDILTSDGLISSPTNRVTSTMVVMTNDGTGHFTIAQDSTFQVVPRQTFTMRLPNGNMYDDNGIMANMELVDINNDGKADLIAGSAADGNDNHIPHWILLNNGNGTFSNYASFTTGIPHFWSLDIIVANNNVYMYGVSVDQTKANVNAGFQYMVVVKYDLTSRAVSTIWNSNGHLWSNEVPSQPHDFNWLMPYNNALVPYNAAYGVAIPM